MRLGSKWWKVVCPYRQASQSGVVHLAYTHGRPVVATRVGGLAEAVLIAAAERSRLRARRQHQVAEPPAPEHRRVRDQAGVREDRPCGRDLRSCVRQRRTVGHVGHDHPVP